MFVFKRNQIIITALVFMVSIAAYLNFTDKRNAVQPTFDDDGDRIAEGSMVDEIDDDFFTSYEFDDISTLPPDFDLDMDEIAEGEDMMDEENIVMSLQDKMLAENQKAKSPSKSNNKDEVVLVNKSHDLDYFVEAKMDREQKRAEQIEMLSECINNETLDKDSKSDAASNLITLQERIEKESSIESLLKAKGFKEVFVRISDDDVDIIINKEKIEDADIAQIEDIVRRKTGYSTSQIKISPLK
ncbi:MAG: SpoIIIAH-like family protein [Epulopiscium sp.]|nr:SpoIIIAH-like family protein [Candidatus Epulonipiscium sp.]